VLINWFTIGAQIVNFLVLVALLKYFLYDRIVSAMDERERKIRERLESADRKKEEAEKRAQDLEAEKKELEDRRQEVLTQAKEDAEKRRKQLLEKARKEVDAQEKQWRDVLQRQKDSVARDLKQMMQNQVFAICRRGLSDLAGVDVDEQASNAFLEQLKWMDPAEKDAMASAIREAGNEITISSSSALSEAAKEQIDQAVKEAFSDQVKIQYRTDSDLVFGIELTTRGRKLAWSLSSYLRSLENSTREALEKESHESKPA